MKNTQHKLTDDSFRFPYWGPFVMETKIDDEFIDLLVEKGIESRDKKLYHRTRLAGMIDNEYYFDEFEDWFVPKFIPYINNYVEGIITAYSADRKFFPAPIAGWTIESFWINYQKANEYNPPHHHEGDLSFIIYLQVPKEIAEEHENAKGERNNPGPGMVVFEYGVQMPFAIAAHYRLPAVGDLLIFPAWLPHHVHAFKSDVERISVSGNLRFKYEDGGLETRSFSV